MKNTNRLNINAALKSLLLLGFAAFFLVSIATGSVTLYVHPRIIPYMVFAAAAMIIIALLLLRELFRPVGKSVNSWPLLFFVIPLITAFALPAQAMNSTDGAIGEVQLSSVGTGSDKETDNAGSSPAIERADSNKGVTLQNGVLIIDSGNFYECLCRIYVDIDKYKGTPVEVAGFVFKDNESFADDEFVPARLMMVCCAADMQPVGLLCRYEKASELKADSWVKVSGTIGETEFDGETIPCIIAESVEITEEPDDAYIYPY